VQVQVPLLKKFMDIKNTESKNLTLGDFFRVKSENIRWVVLRKDEFGVIGLRTYNRDPNKFYVSYYVLQDLIPVEVPKVRIGIFKEAVENFFEKYGNYYFDNLTYIEILGKLI
jgi:hypothetical protein